LAGRTPQEAVEDFLEPLREVVGCITDEGFVTRRPGSDGEQQTAAFQSGFTILERPSGDALRLELLLRYVIVQAEGERGLWKVSTREYIYEIADERDELVAAYHWHPQSGRITWPHVHVYGARDSLTLHKLHLPTGCIPVESIVRFLVEDLGVQPLRPNWDEIIIRREVASRQWRTWH
jgi:hypothetical protein